MSDEINKLRNKVIVSVQAEGSEPLNSPENLLALSQSVINGGAGGLRLCGIKNIKHIKKKVLVPIIGLTKLEPTPFNWLDTVYISAKISDIKELITCGVEFIAVDGTKRPRADGSTLEDQIILIKENNKIAIADISTFDEAMGAAELGADIVSTTLSGYTKETRFKVNEGPDFELLAELTQESPAPVIMEGRIWYPQEVKKAFEMGAFAVVIGTAITRPHMITKRFVSVAPKE
ncbi:MAG: hypothetical protein A3B68_02885 [Candidatus Melainabacteria bacterium RIFCSPHIGHO2_02_FULL_34_12]|nr:MAG: hypothetical protein A3B68_02885 [Candidatus Melainabacteria bacterium RIFCSPHIGHO2_02_FULL_34_12]